MDPEPALADRLRLTVLVVQGRYEALLRLVEAAPHLRGPEGREALLQCHLFAGFPRVVEAFAVLRERGLGAPTEEELPAPGSLRPDGVALFDRIYGRRADAVRGVLEGGHPELARWVADHAYGEVLARPVLSAVERELLAVVALAASGLDRQLASHARGAVACGAEPDRVVAALDAVEGELEPGLYDQARRLAERFAAPERAPD